MQSNVDLNKSCRYKHIFLCVYLYVYGMESSERTVVMNGQKQEQMEWVHTTFIKPMLQALQTRVECGHTGVFSDVSANLPDGSGILLRVPSVNVTHGISHLVTEHLSCLRFHQEAIAVVGLIRLIYLFVYLQCNIFTFLDFKLLPCSECFMLSSGI